MESSSQLDVRIGGAMIYEVVGSTQIGWTVEVQANSPAEAEEKAKQYWGHNTTSESVEVNAVYDARTGEVQ